MSPDRLPRLDRVERDPRPQWAADAKGELCRYLADFPKNVRFGLGLTLAEQAEAAARATNEALVTVNTLRASIAQLTDPFLEESDA